MKIISWRERMKINNCKQLLEEWAGTPFGDSVVDDEHAQQIMAKYIFKHTECGCCFSADEGGVTVAGYTEGSDYDHFPYYLKWGFTIEEFNNVLNDSDAEGVEEWERVNEDENYEDHKETEWPDEQDIGGEG
jgi:hypothetical protein